MLYYGHVTAITCGDSAKSAVQVLVRSFDDLSDIRRILDNLVHNFGVVYVSISDLVDYFGASEEGQELQGPYQAGFAAGRILFYAFVDDSSSRMVDPISRKNGSDPAAETTDDETANRIFEDIFFDD